MKIKFEFDTDSENFNRTELEIYKQANDMAMCLSAILDKLRAWYKYDNRESIPIDEIHETLIDIINEHVDIERMGY